MARDNFLILVIWIFLLAPVISYGSDKVRTVRACPDVLASDGGKNLQVRIPEGETSMECRIYNNSGMYITSHSTWHVSPDDAYAAYDEACTYVYLPGQYCDFTFWKREPSEKGLIFGFVLIFYDTWPGGSVVRGETYTYNVDGYKPAPPDPEPEEPEEENDSDPDEPTTPVEAGFVEPGKCMKTKAGSILRVDNLSFGESVSVVGTPFSLVYSSEYASGFYTPHLNRVRYPSFNPEGWTVSIIHSYDSVHNRLYYGTGRSLIKPYSEINTTEIMVVDDDGVYIFDKASGRHLRTLTSLLGVVRYSFLYTSSGRIQKITDLYGNETSFVRRVNGSLQEIVAPRGQITKIFVDIEGLINKIINPASEAVLIRYYQNLELLKEFVLPSGVKTTVVYDSKGRIVSNRKAGSGYDFSIVGDSVSGENYTVQKSTEGLTWKYRNEREPMTGKYRRWERSPAGVVTIYTEEDDGAGVNRNGMIFSQGFDEDIRFGNLKNRLSWSGITLGTLNRTVYYDQFVQGLGSTPFDYTSILNEVDNDGVIYESEFVKANRTLTSTSAEGQVKVLKMNAQEQVIEVKNGNEESTFFEYNSWGSLKKVTRGLRVLLDIQYNQNGYPSTVSRSGQGAKNYQYDLAGRVSSVLLPGGDTIGYQYSPDGYVIGITPPGRLSHVFSFNNYGLLSAYQPPLVYGENSTIKVQYDSDKRLRSVERPGYNRLSYEYARTGNISAIRYAGNSIGYSYYPNTDQIEKVRSFDGVETSYKYNGDLITSVSQSVGKGSDKVSSISYSYDNQFRPVKSTFSADYLPSSFIINRSFDDDDRMISAGDMSFGYESVNGRLSAAVLKNIQSQWSYNSYGEVVGYSTHLIKNSSSLPLYSYTLERDVAGRIFKKTEVVRGKSTVFEYGYDDLSRLIWVKKNGLKTDSYLYDTNGNRVSGHINGRIFTASYDGQDRILTFNSTQYFSSTSGDVTGVQEPILSKVHSFKYGQLGRMTSYTMANGNHGQFLENSEGQIVQWVRNGTNMRYGIYEGMRLVSSFDEVSRSSQQFVYGENVLTPSYMMFKGRAYRFITDHLGSPRLIVDAENGEVLQEISYDIWGRVLADTNIGVQPFSFAGGVLNFDTGLVRFGARDYDPEVGRWTSKDPILFEGGDTNLFGYVQNDPINFIDPEGTFPWAIAAAFLGSYFWSSETDTPGAATSELWQVPAAGLMCGGAVGGKEIVIGGMRFAPFGNRTSNPTGQLPHYHRSVPNPARPGESIPGQGIGRHRPWDVKSPDKSFWDRF